MKRFVFIAQFRDNCGYAVAARGYLKALDHYLKMHPKAFHLSIFTIPLETNNSKITEEEEALIEKYEISYDEVDNLIIHNQPQYTVIWSMPPPMIVWKDKSALPIWIKVKQLFDHSSDNVNISFWEATDIPRFWMDIFDAIKTSKVIVACDWNEQVYRRRLGERVYRVPCVVEQSDIKDITEISSLRSLLSGKYVFLSVAQWQPRKGLKDLLRAYYMEFAKRQDVVLVLKTYINIMNNNPMSASQQKQEIQKQIVEIRNSIYLDDGSNPSALVVVVPGAISKGNLNWLYNSCNAFVLPTRGEGFCIPLAEAMQFNKRVIVPREGGHVDLLRGYPEDSIFLTDGMWQPYEGLPGYTCNMDWYLADIKSVRKQMRAAFESGLVDHISPQSLSLNTIELVGDKLAGVLLNV